jgi:NADPH-dependent 2,4-dienoyl-CoA reductase/sulfur reductase-like enzyme
LDAAHFAEPPYQLLKKFHVSFRLLVLFAYDGGDIERESQSLCDAVALGGGYAGLMAALSLGGARGKISASCWSMR